jgi:uncharacterized membrane protein YgcG
MFTGITSHPGVLVATLVALTGAAALGGGTAAADPRQDNQFLALLNAEHIPALKNVPSLIATAHRDCRKLDSGTSASALVREKLNNAYNVDPVERGYPVDRLTRTMTLFIAAAVRAYCPYDQGKIAAIMPRQAKDPTHRVAAYGHEAVNAGSELGEPAAALATIEIPADYDARGPVLAAPRAAVPSGDLTPPNPPQIPPPSPPAARIQPPHRVIAAQPRPTQQPPRAPAVAPQPGGAAGSGGGNSGGVGNGSGGGSTGGGAPAAPAPAPTLPPGFVRLAP